jgi:hypothetical protein
MMLPTRGEDQGLALAGYVFVFSGGPVNQLKIEIL